MTAQDLVAEARASVDEVGPGETGPHPGAPLTVLDVREPGEYAGGHLPGAINVPRGVLEFKVGSHPALTDPDCPVLVYCKTGGRGLLAARILLRMGFRRVTNLAGGFDAWARAGQPVEKDPAVC